MIKEGDLHTSAFNEKNVLYFVFSSFQDYSNRYFYEDSFHSRMIKRHPTKWGFPDLFPLQFSIYCSCLDESQLSDLSLIIPFESDWFQSTLMLFLSSEDPKIS